jgi:hypothetical protein
LIKVTEVRHGHGEAREYRGEVVRHPPTAAMLRVTKVVTLFQELARGNELPEEKVDLPSHAATQQFRADIVPHPADSFHVLGN